MCTEPTQTMTLQTDCEVECWRISCPLLYPDIELATWSKKKKRKPCNARKETFDCSPLHAKSVNWKTPCQTRGFSSFPTLATLQPNFPVVSESKLGLLTYYGCSLHTRDSSSLTFHLASLLSRNQPESEAKNIYHRSSCNFFNICFCYLWHLTVIRSRSQKSMDSCK